MRIDLHVHTEYSHDSLLKIDQLKSAVIKGKVDAIAVTDHNEIEGALRIKKTAPFQVIVGEEIRTTAGEIIGLFLKQKIEAGLSPMETIMRIKDQGGLVMIPHPFDHFRSTALERETLLSLVEHIDLVEVLNGRNVFQKSNALADAFAEQNQLLKAAGSDAHMKGEVGNVFVEMEPFMGKDDFLRNIKTADVSGRKNSLAYHLLTKTIKVLGLKINQGCFY